MTKLLTLLAAAILAGTSTFAQSKPAKTTTTTTTKTTSTTTTTTIRRKKDGEIFTFVEQMPEASYDVAEFLSKNIVYPEKARLNNITGRVIVKFVVDEYGFVRKPEIMRSAHPLLDSAAVVVVKKMPKWRPGISKGKPVKVYYSLPIKFSLEEPAPKNEPFGGGVR